MYQSKLTPEEALEAIKLRMKYDAKLTLDENKSLVSEQGLTKNQQLAINFGYGPVSAQYADQLAKLGKFVGKVEGNTSMFPNSNQQFKVGNPTPSPAPYSSMFPNSNQQFKVGTPTPSAPAAAPAPAPAPVKPPKTTVPYIPKGLNDTKGVQEFQKWLDSTQGDWAWSPRLQKKYKVEGNPKRGFGKFGPSTEKFWNNPDIRKQFMDFVEGKAQTTSTTTTSTTSTPNVNVVGKQVSPTAPTAPTTPITRKSPAKGFQDYMKDKPLGLGSDTQPTPPALTTNKVIANKNTEF